MDSSSGPATSFSMRGAFKEAQPRILYVLNKVPVSLGPALTLGALRHPVLPPLSRWSSLAMGRMALLGCWNFLHSGSSELLMPKSLVGSCSALVESC